METHKFMIQNSQHKNETSDTHNKQSSPFKSWLNLIWVVLIYYLATNISTWKPKTYQEFIEYAENIPISVPFFAQKSSEKSLKTYTQIPTETSESPISTKTTTITDTTLTSVTKTTITHQTTTPSTTTSTPQTSTKRTVIKLPNTNVPEQTKVPSQNGPNQLIPNELNISYPHAFKFDGRPKEILYKTTKNEVKLCTCGEFDCLEQDSTKHLFENEKRPSYEEYKTILTDPKVRTSSENSDFEVEREARFISVKITAKNGYNVTKKFGGDFWIVRLIAFKKDKLIVRLKPSVQQRHVKQIVVPPIHSIDHTNGTYVFKFLILPEEYTTTLNFKLQVYLERSAEMIEVNRRAMSSYHIVGRVMRVNLPLIPSENNAPRKPRLGECGMVPLDKACNFSVSADRTWYCYTEHANCGPFEQNLKFSVTKTTNDMFGIADVLASCSVGMMKKVGKYKGNDIFSEVQFQEKAFEINYEKIVEIEEKDGNNRSILNNFDHWCYGKWVTGIQNLEILEKDIDNTSKSVTAVKNVHPITDTQLEDFHKILTNRTIIVIGDSLSQQIQEFMVDVVRRRSKCHGWTYINFWGARAEKKCYQGHPFNPKYSECIGSETKTTFVLLPHGKPVHHGGCSHERMPWMIDSIARVEKYANLNDRTVILLGPGAHFSAANPAYFFNRLLELKPVLEGFKKRHPYVKIIFKTPNYFPGDFYEQKATISAYNARRLEVIIDRIFGGSELFDVVKLYEKTEVVFDVFQRSAKGIHPGSDGGAKWVLNEIVRWILEKF